MSQTNEPVLRINPETGQPEQATGFEPVTRATFEDAVTKADAEHTVAQQELEAAEQAQVIFEQQYDQVVGRVNTAIKAEEEAADALAFQQGRLGAFDELLQSSQQTAVTPAPANDAPAPDAGAVTYTDAPQDVAPLAAPVDTEQSETATAEATETTADDEVIPSVAQSVPVRTA